MIKCLRRGTTICDWSHSTHSTVKILLSGMNIIKANAQITVLLLIVSGVE